MYRSQQIEKYQTASIPQWRESGYDYKGTVQYGMHYIFGNSQPYFSITASTLRKNSKGGGWKEDSGGWKEDSGGCLHDLIKQRKKSLAPLIKFHLCDQDGLPMYYLENGFYWYKENLETFKNYILLEEDEVIPELPDVYYYQHDEKEQEKYLKTFITSWLKLRIPRLKQRFDDTMKHFNVEYISLEEIETLKAKNKVA